MSRQNRAIGVLIASENTLLRECLAERIGREPGFQVMAQVDDTTDLTAHLKRSLPAVLLFDSDGFGALPTTVLSRLRERWPELKILAIATRSDEFAAARALRSGAAGVLGKSDTVVTLFRALEVVASGDAWAGRKAIARALTGRQHRRPPRALTPRERQLLGLLADGYRNKELALLLRIKEQTVKIHLHSLFQKLNVRTRVEAALKAGELV